jgi:Heterokaryon incompatibility protein (HET)
MRSEDFVWSGISMPLDRCLWIDAISINQNDNSERTYQVKLMPQNYANASLVEIYIGEAA